MHRVVTLARLSGEPGYPGGEFLRTDEQTFEDLGMAERAAHQFLAQPYPRVIRVEVDIEYDGEWRDISFEAERLPSGQTWWFIGPPPDRSSN